MEQAALPRTLTRPTPASGRGLEAGQRAAIVAEARTWVGTPYHNCADVKGVGVDCGMLIVRVFVDTGLVAPFDPRPYPADWHLHRSEEKYLGFVFDRCVEVPHLPPPHAGEGSLIHPPPQAGEGRVGVQPGDVAVFKFGRTYSHGGIVTRAQPLTMVHAYVKAHGVYEDEIARIAKLADPKRAPRFFSFWAKRG